MPGVSVLHVLRSTSPNKRLNSFGVITDHEIQEHTATRLYEINECYKIANGRDIWLYFYDDFKDFTAQTLTGLDKVTSKSLENNYASTVFTLQKTL